MQITPPWFVSAETTGALLRTLTITTLVLLIIEFILGEITHLFVQILFACVPTGENWLAPGRGPGPTDSWRWLRSDSSVQTAQASAHGLWSRRDPA